MRLVLAAFAVCAAAVSLPGCSSSTSAGNCSTTVRYQDAVYSETGFTEKVEDEIGSADLADCEDVGSDARGPFFPEDPEQVTVWSIPGKIPATTIAIADPDGGYRVMKLVNGG